MLMRELGTVPDVNININIYMICSTGLKKCIERLAQLEFE
jgi:hypothetical protein